MFCLHFLHPLISAHFEILHRDESGWWLFPTGLILLKCIQARLVDWHVGNLEIQDRAVYSNDPSIFWQS